MVISFVKGLWTAIRNPKLVLLLWSWNLLLGLAAVMPARAWFGGALDTATEAGALLTRFNFGTFSDLSKYNDVAPMTLLVASLLGVGIVALAGNAFMNGGILEVIGSPADTRPFMHRFFRGGGHFFWRFVRLNVAAFVAGAVVAGVVLAGTGAVVDRLPDSEWEPAGLLRGAVPLALAGLCGMFFVIALDYARIRTSRDDGRSMVRTYAAALGFVGRRLLGTYGITFLYLVAVCGLLLAYVAHEAVWTTATWRAIWLLIGVQQAILIARTGLRVAQVGAEWHYFAAAQADTSESQGRGA